MGQKRRLGDRKDAALIRDIDALHLVMCHLYLNRTDNEAYISEQIELEPIYKWIESHKDEEFKYTFFHVIIAAIMKLLIEKPKLNRFISNRKYYQRNENIVSFVAKRQFTEEAKEAMIVLKGTEEDTIFSIHEGIKKKVLPAKQGLNNGTEDDIDFLLKLPRFLQRIVLSVVRKKAEKGTLPKSMTEGDSNHASVFVTNLGSIGLKCGYHHLANYGTSSIFVVIGEKKLTPFYDKDGNVTMKETLDLGLTIDERIADGFYYAKSVKLLKHVIEHPELLEKPFGERLDF